MEKRFVLAAMLCAAAVLCACAQSAGSSGAAGESASFAASAGSAAQGGAVSASDSGAGGSSAPAAAAGIDPLTGLPLAEGESLTARPAAVLVDNVQAALPQRGLSGASLLYEAVSEGGITHLLAVYANPALLPQVGPVCDARPQHVQLAFPLDAVLVYRSGTEASDALLEQCGWQQRTLSGSAEQGALKLDDARSAAAGIAHSWFTDASLYASACGTYGIDAARTAPAQTAFPFTGTSAPRTLALADGGTVYVRFSGYTNTTLTYRPALGRYEKAQFGAPQIDEVTGSVLSFENVFVLFAHMQNGTDIDYAAGGSGYYFCGGRYEELRWTKDGPAAPLTLTALSGEPLTVNPGRSYIALADEMRRTYFRIQPLTAAETDAAPADSAADAVSAIPTAGSVSAASAAS